MATHEEEWQFCSPPDALTFFLFSYLFLCVQYVSVYGCALPKACVYFIYRYRMVTGLENQGKTHQAKHFHHVPLTRL